MQRRPLPDRQGGLVCATSNLVAPLAFNATAKRIRDITGRLTTGRRSRAVFSLIGGSLRWSDVDSAIQRSTSLTATTRTTRTSTTATRTTGTRTTSSWRVPSADENHSAAHADFSFNELVQAYFDCRQRKRNTASALRFEQNLEENLRHLYEDLKEGTYRPGRSICFVIGGRKPREVWAADFRDRIVHHLLYNRVAPRFYASFIPDSCACIPGRGTLYAAQRLESKVRSITQNWSQPAYYLKADLANFFVSIDKRILRDLLAKRIIEPWWMALAETVLFHDPRENVEVRGDARRLALMPPHKSLFRQPAHLGLPIGNLSSQFFANVYLDVLDQFAKHRIGARYYIRYVDDFVILHESAYWLNDARHQIELLLGDRLAQRLNPSKTVIQPIDRGIDFVGQVALPWRRVIRRRALRTGMHRLSKLQPADLYESANSYFGLCRQATHSHQDRVQIARLLLRRGRSVNGALTKTYRRHVS